MQTPSYFLPDHIADPMIIGIVYGLKRMAIDEKRLKLLPFAAFILQRCRHRALEGPPVQHPGQSIVVNEAAKWVLFFNMIGLIIDRQDTLGAIANDYIRSVYHQRSDVASRPLPYLPTLDWAQSRPISPRPTPAVFARIATNIRHRRRQRLTDPSPDTTPTQSTEAIHQRI